MLHNLQYEYGNGFTGERKRLIVKQIIAIAALLMLAARSAAGAADFTVVDDGGYRQLLGDLELRGRIPALSGCGPYSAGAINGAVIAQPDSERYRSYRQELAPFSPSPKSMALFFPDVWLKDRSELKRFKLPQNYRAGIGGSWNDWSFLAVDKFFTTNDALYSYYGKQWRGYAGGSDQVYVRWSTPQAYVQLGKDYAWSGLGMALSGTAPFEKVQAAFPINRFVNIYCFMGQLDKYQDSLNNYYNRYLAWHRIEFNYRGLQLGLSEMMLYGGVGRPWELYYLLPFYIFLGEQDNRNIDDNVLWDIDAKLVLPPFRLAGELVIDDFQIEHKIASDREPAQMGGALQADWALSAQPSFLTASARYEMITNWAFNQNKPWNRFLFEGNPIGTPWGNDYDRLMFKMSSAGKTGQGYAEIHYMRKGEDRIDAPWTAPWLADSTWRQVFPSGVVEKYVGLECSASRFWTDFNWGPVRGTLAFKVFAGYDRIFNCQHVPETSLTG